jgi:hypothetical protein
MPLRKYVIKIKGWRKCSACGRGVDPKAPTTIKLPNLDVYLHSRCKRSQRALEEIADRITVITNEERILSNG